MTDIWAGAEKGKKKQRQSMILRDAPHIPFLGEIVVAIWNCIWSLCTMTCFIQPMHNWAFSSSQKSVAGSKTTERWEIWPSWGDSEPTASICKLAVVSSDSASLYPYRSELLYNTNDLLASSVNNRAIKSVFDFWINECENYYSIECFSISKTAQVEKHNKFISEKSTKPGN